MALEIQLNGKLRAFDELTPEAAMSAVLTALALKADRVAVELNGDIVRRAEWDATTVRTGDRLEVVHFVGGGIGECQ
jgi:thiamine biosynthesis protein ThiS